MANQTFSQQGSWYSTLAKGAAVQRRVIGALMLRELHTRYGRDNIGYAWLIAEPLLLAGAIAGIHELSGLHARGGISPVAFAAVGYTMFMLIRQIFTRAEGSIESNVPLLHHRQVTLADVCIARGLLELISVSSTFMIVAAVSYLAGWSGPPERPLYVVAAFALVFVFSVGCGMLICCACEFNRIAVRLVHPMTYLLIPASGSFYAIAWLSPHVREYIFYWPFPHFFEMMRYGMFPTASGEFFSIPYMIFVSLVTFVSGLSSLRLAQNHVHGS